MGMAIVLTVSACALARPATSVAVIAPQIDALSRQDGPGLDWALQVRRPVTDRMRDSEQILIRTDNSRLQPYPGASWLDNAPDMLQALMVQTLSDSGRLAGVGRSGNLRSRFALATELRRFEGVDDGSGGLSVELLIQASLIDQRSGSVAASRSFPIREPVGGRQLDTLVPAFERAIHGYLDELTAWVLDEGQAQPR
jgi:cholesterol transport system auxiliary component